MYHLGKSLYLWATSKEEYSVLLLGLDNAGKTTLLNTVKSLYPTTSSTHPSASNTTAAPESPLPLIPSKPTVPTVGQNVSTLHLPDMYLKIWDVGGQEGLRSLWTSYFDVCHAIVFVVDGCDVGDGDILEGEDVAEEENDYGGDDDDGDDDDDDVDEDQNADFPNTSRTRQNGTKLHRPGGKRKASTASSTAASSSQGRLPQARAALSSVLMHPSTASIPLLVLANKQDREDCVETVRIKEGLVRPVFEGELRGGPGGVRDSRVLPVSALRGDGVREAVDWVRSRVKWGRDRGGREPVMR